MIENFQYEKEFFEGLPHDINTQFVLFSGGQHIQRAL